MLNYNFAAFILTHGRPDNLITLKSLERVNYTGRVIIVIDNEDSSADRYKELYGDAVYEFDKADVATRMDEGDNFGDRRSIVYARNACFEIAKELGIDYFIQLDDDYTCLQYRLGSEGYFVRGAPWIKDFDHIMNAMVEFIATTPVHTVAMAQGGDFIGGTKGKPHVKRKAMNSFVCSTHKPFKFVGRINEDVNTYTSVAGRGTLFLTHMGISLNQKQTQTNSGGMTDIYMASGTYVKSFYSVMYNPSSVKVGVLSDRGNPRLHHSVNWRCTVPQILEEKYKR